MRRSWIWSIWELFIILHILSNTSKIMSTLKLIEKSVIYHHSLLSSNKCCWKLLWDRLHPRSAPSTIDLPGCSVGGHSGHALYACSQSTPIMAAPLAAPDPVSLSHTHAGVLCTFQSYYLHLNPCLKVFWENPSWDEQSFTLFVRVSFIFVNKQCLGRKVRNGTR